MVLKRILMTSVCGMIFALSSCKNGNFTSTPNQGGDFFAYLIEVFSSNTSGEWTINASALSTPGSVWSCWIEQAGNPTGTTFARSSAKKFTTNDSGMLTMVLTSSCKSGAAASDLRILCNSADGDGNTKSAPYVNGVCK